MPNSHKENKLHSKEQEMSFDKSFRAYFVTTAKSSSDVSETTRDFETAITYLRAFVPEENIRHIKPSEGFPLIASGQLTKKDVFIFDHFTGDFFKQLQLTKSLLVGTRCLISCLVRNEPIPLGSSPVFTSAMRDLQICATGISPQEKERLRELIHWMGGHYFHNLGNSITHLISNTIKSAKYEKATTTGKPVMHVDWVQRVWERSCVEDISATDEEFMKYKLPIFFGTNITCTGLDSKKNEVMRLVNENGGTYHGTFRSTVVDIVITEKDKTNSEKYKAAVRYKKDILTPEWIFESVRSGYALPTKDYEVKTLKVSTPTKTDRSIADFSHISDISHISARSSRSDMANTVNETKLNDTQQQQDATFLPPAPVASRDRQKKTGSGAHYRLTYDEICPKQAKKAGNFLDGCCIYLSGFRLEEREKLNRILNVGGATRYDIVNEKITHIVVGQLDDAEVRVWRKEGLLTAANIVHLDWLLQSIKLKQPANEALYRVSLPTTREPDAPSPSSKRTLRSMNHSFKQPADKSKKKLFEGEDKAAETPLLKPMASSTELPPEEDEHNLIAQYSQENEPAVEVPQLPPAKIRVSVSDTLMAHPIASSTLNPSSDTPQTKGVSFAVGAIAQPPPSDSTDVGMSAIDYDNLDFFQGLTIFVDKRHFPEEFYSQMINECESAQGNIVAETFRDEVDYAIVSFERTVNVAELPVKARYIITELYVEECLKANKLLHVDYYHRYIPHTADSLPLSGMTIVISVYTALERDFVDSLAQQLGAKVNKTFVKKEKPLLICPRPEGSKYEGALKWRYPVVTSNWLVQCAVRGEKLSFNDFLVGESPADFPISPSGTSRNVSVTPVRAVLAEKSMEDCNTLQNESLSVDQPNDFTPLRNPRVSELAGTSASKARYSLSNNADSPHTPTNNYARATYNFDFMDRLLDDIENEDERECLRELIVEMKNNQTPELERIRRQACTPINRKVPTPKGIPEFCTTPEFRQRMADEFERRWRLPTKKMKPDTPIEEIRRRVLRATCAAVGVPFIEDVEETSMRGSDQPSTSSAKRSAATAALTPPNAHDTAAKLSATNQRSTPRSALFNYPNSAKRPSIASPKDANNSDTFVPGTQSPDGSSMQQDIVSGLGPQASIMGKTSIDFDKINFEDTEPLNITREKQCSSAAAASPEIQKITDYLRNCESRRESMKRSHGQADAAQPQATDTEGHYVQPFESEQFGVGTDEMVGWRDPAEFGKERRSKSSIPLMQHQGSPPRFSISCNDDEMRNSIMEKIMRLGGLISKNLVNFDPTSTHFVCQRPNRGEKMLGCIASGKWVLSLKYIEECFARDCFIDEELYEWGNCKALNLPQLTMDEQLIAQAAHKWRKELASDPDGGAFSSFRVLIRVAESNSNAIKNVIRAGKGIVLDATPPYSASTESQLATHCFVDMKKAPLSKVDYDYLRLVGVGVYTQVCINTYLMYGSDCDFSKYEIKM